MDLSHSGRSLDRGLEDLGLSRGIKPKSSVYKGDDESERGVGVEVEKTHTVERGGGQR